MSIFGSRTREKILTLFFTEPDREFFMREVERKAGENINSVRRELLNLSAQDILRKETKGRQIFYKTNKDSPIFEELKGIVVKTFGVCGAIKDELSKAKDLELALVYGSFAKGEFRGDSDIDLLIAGTADETQVIQIISPLESKLRREINYVYYSPKEIRDRLKKKDTFLSNALSRYVLLLGDIDEYR